MRIANTTKALQGVHTKNGLVYLKPGQTRDDLELSDEQVGRVREIKGLAVLDGTAPESRKNGDTPEMARLRARFDAAYAKRGEELDAARNEVSTWKEKADELEGRLKSANERIAELEAADNEKGLPAKLEATHRGRGSFSIMYATELVEGLDKEAADKFNALSDEEKVKFVEANRKAG